MSDRLMQILFLSHSHPSLQAGGTEIFSRDLFRDLCDREGLCGAYVAGTARGQRQPAPGTAFQGVGNAPDEVLLWTAGFDTFHLSQTDLHGVIPELSAFLQQLRPEIVHVHHVLQLGLEVLPLIRRLLPSARLVLTLHDFYAICAHDGQMCTPEGTLCTAAAADACRRCLPDRTATDLRMRDLHVRSAFRVVDRFIAPSETLRNRFVDWGLEPDRIEVIRNGIVPAEPVRPARHEGPRNRFGFFGHINQFKGARVALNASERLSRSGVAHSLALHGGTAFQRDTVITRFQKALAAAPDAGFTGSYGREDLPRLMSAVDWVIVPSIWWENAPLVIQEAFQHGRPVICSDVGGMAEAVRHGVDGLHFPVGDSAALAATMRRAAEHPGLWEQLSSQILPPRSIAQAAADHVALYGRLLGAAVRPAMRGLARQPLAMKACP